MYVVKIELEHLNSNRCGVSDEELDRKKKAYLDHLKEDPTLGFSVIMTR